MRKMGICAISALSIQASTVAGAQTAVPLTPTDFIRAAAESDHYEIAAATVAQTQSHDPRVRAFAQKMMQDHIQTSVALTRAAIAAGLALPEPGMSGDQSSFLASLQSLRGLDFDRAYAKQHPL